MRDGPDRLPLRGERVGTPDGEGYVEDVDEWEDVRWTVDRERLGEIRARLGPGFTESYARVTVSLDDEDDRLETYDIWEIDHDPEPLDGPPWRG